MVYGWRNDVMRAAVELVLADHAAGGTGLERLEVCGFEAWHKRSLFSGRARWRWGLKRALGARIPRVAEYFNHSWLLERLFETPLPLAAGEIVAGGLPVRQFLFSRHVDDAPTLETVLSDRAHPEREAILAQLAREVARMHALGFVHHDLYPRNVLVRGSGHARRLLFLDAWAGGPPPQWRDAAYDLGCLWLFADTELAPEELAGFQARYAAERTVQARPVDAPGLFARALAARERLITRLEARAHERRGRPLPGEIPRHGEESR